MACYNINRFHVLVMICWQFGIFFATQMLFPIFSMYVPRWRCNLANETSSGKEFSKDCNVYKSCDPAFIEFENDYFDSMALEFDWFCGNNSYIIYAYSQTQFFGVLLGTLLWGTCSDSFGRRPVAIFVLSFGILALGLSSFGQIWQWVLITRFFIGLAIGGTLVVVCTFIMEMLLPQQRMPLRACFNWGMARLLMTGLCFIFPDWRRASIACAVSSLPALLIVIFAFPESPTWLHSKGKLELMRNSERKIARVAGVEYKEIPHRTLEKSLTFWQSLCVLIRTKSLFRKLLVLWMMWLTASVSGYSIDLHSSNLSGNLFLNQCYFSVLTSLSKIVLVLVDTKFPGFSRRMLHQGAQFVVVCCFLMLACLVMLHQEHSIWVVLVNVVGLSFIEYTWDACYLCGVETPPTELRSTSLGTCSFVARIGAILAPTVVFLNTLWAPSAYIIVVILGCLNLLISFNWLVETKGVNLDDVVL